MTISSLARWPSPSQLDGPADLCGEAAGRLLTVAHGPDDPCEGILHFPVRWDAVSKASHLKALTGLPWGVEYHAHSNRFRVVLGDDSIRCLRAAIPSGTDGSPGPAVGEHRFDSA
jgi:hypothetical protein